MISGFFCIYLLSLLLPRSKFNVFLCYLSLLLYNHICVICEICETIFCKINSRFNYFCVFRCSPNLQGDGVKRRENTIAPAIARDSCHSVFYKKSACFAPMQTSVDPPLLVLCERYCASDFSNRSCEFSITMLVGSP